MSANPPTVNPWMILPFGVLLAAIALGPLLFPKWWLRHYAKPVFALALITLGYYFFGLGAFARVGHMVHEYFSFIA
ncbi:MAG TPA: sodium:proton antiporter, partial [Verrucomicrobiae bacterium]|nr:sodium:proton antiporter [Verrucomicrobiae bacterium]